MSNKLIKIEVLEASKQWIVSFNKADVEVCSKRYSNNAVMDARPIGRYEGREKIYEFWNTFVNSTNATDLTYINIHIEVVDDNSAKLSAQWSMNVASGFITEELWVKENGAWFLSYDDFTVEEQF